MRRAGGLVVVGLLLGGCGGADATERDEAPASTAAPATTSPPTTELPPTSTTAAPVPDPFARPDWLGTRVLPDGPGGFGAVLPTPAELDPRRLRTPDHLSDPPGDAFVSSITVVPDDVLARSTWEPGCPVSVDELRYVTVTFWGFDGEHHTGELLLNASMADDVVSVFEQLDAARFPIEEMRVTAREELDLPPTGDGNNTSAFVCRPVRSGRSFSQHAYGTAIDVNPFHNPYVRGEVVLPELASAYLDRANLRDGMHTDGSVTVTAFDAMGWEWGGAWDGSAIDPMHFSALGG
jgi:hypothetical protein